MSFAGRSNGSEGLACSLDSFLPRRGEGDRLSLVRAQSTSLTRPESDTVTCVGGPFTTGRSFRLLWECLGSGDRSSDTRRRSADTSRTSIKSCIMQMLRHCARPGLPIVKSRDGKACAAAGREQHLQICKASATSTYPLLCYRTCLSMCFGIHTFLRALFRLVLLFLFCRRPTPPLFLRAHVSTAFT